MRPILSCLCFGMAVVLFVLSGCRAPGGCTRVNPRGLCGPAPVPRNGHYVIVPNPAPGQTGPAGHCAVKADAFGGCAHPAGGPQGADDCVGYGVDFNNNPQLCACSDVPATEAGGAKGCTCGEAAANAIPPGTHAAHNPDDPV